MKARSETVAVAQLTGRGATGIVRGVRAYWRSQARLVCALGGAALGVALGLGATAPRANVPGAAGPTLTLARELSLATGFEIAPEALVAEDGLPGVLRYGRVLFLGRSTPGVPRDLYRAEVRATPDGRLLALGSMTNLTSTPHGDETDLAVGFPFAAYATRVLGRVQSVTALDLRGEPESARRNLTVFDWMLARITNLQRAGAPEGLGKIVFGLSDPASDVRIRVDRDRLRLDWRSGQDDLFAVGAIDRPDGVPAISGSGAGRLSIDRTDRLPKRLILWLVDTVRAIPWVGPEPVAWLEETVYALTDAVRRARHGLLDRSMAPNGRVEVAQSNDSAAGAETDGVRWPPPRAEAPLGFRQPGEGVWSAVRYDFLRTLPEAPPTFYRTYVRPDPTRPYVRVELVVADARQVELGMQAGVEDPIPTTGNPGEGRIPRRPEILSRVIAVFNGAFKTEHGAYGMMVDGRVLVPPAPNAATVATYDDGRIGFGTWGDRPDLPPQVVSLRQNLDPLVADGVVNPTRRHRWGFALKELSGMQTVRSGMCLTEGGHILYAWGADLNATTLGRAMLAGGCGYAIHLDMNPFHTAFQFMRIDDLARGQFRQRVLASGMILQEDKYLSRAPKDFFYLLLRDPAPHRPAGVRWTALPADLLPPRFLPIGHEATIDVGGTPVRLLAIAPGRASLRLEPGLLEMEANGVVGGLPRVNGPRGPVIARVLAGTAADAVPGLILDRQSIAPPAPGVGTLAIYADGQVRIGLWGADVRLDRSAGHAELVDALQGPILIRAGVVQAIAPAGPGASRATRVGLGIDEAGRLLIAQGDLPDDRGLAQTLLMSGATVALSLDRGRRVERGVWVRDTSAAAATTVLRALSDGRATLPTAPQATVVIVEGRTLGLPTFRLDRPSQSAGSTR